MSNIKKIRHLTEDEKSTIKKAFDFLDTDKDGYLDYHEMKAATRALGFEATKSQVLAIMNACDKQGGNKIGFQDFYYIMADKVAKRDPVDELKFAYKLFTSESTCGKISVVDLQRINKNLGCRLTEDEMRAMIEEFDEDLDGCKNRRTLLEERAALDRTAQSVLRSQTVAAETEQIGRVVVEELGTQRETLLRAKTRLSETDQELDTSRKIMRMISKGVLTNKIVLILLILLEMAILGLTVYLKYFSKK